MPINLWGIIFSTFGTMAILIPVVLWLGKKWLSTRIEESIKYEYNKELEKYKNDFNRELQKTELFFEYQQKAFTSLIDIIMEISDNWTSECMLAFDEYEPAPAPNNAENILKKATNKYRLFLDQDCAIAFNLLLDALHDGHKEAFDYSSYDPYDRFVSIARLTINMFQEKIGLSNKSYDTDKKIGLLGALYLLNIGNSISIPKTIKIHKGEYVSSLLDKVQKNRGDITLALQKHLKHLENKKQFDFRYEEVCRCLNVLK